MAFIFSTLSAMTARSRTVPSFSVMRVARVSLFTSLLPAKSIFLTKGSSLTMKVSTLPEAVSARSTVTASKYPMPKRVRMSSRTSSGSKGSPAALLSLRVMASVSILRLPVTTSLSITPVLSAGLVLRAPVMRENISGAASFTLSLSSATEAAALE